MEVALRWPPFLIGGALGLLGLPRAWLSAFSLNPCQQILRSHKYVYIYICVYMHCCWHWGVCSNNYSSLIGVGAREWTMLADCVPSALVWWELGQSVSPCSPQHLFWRGSTLSTFWIFREVVLTKSELLSILCDLENLLWAKIVNMPRENIYLNLSMMWKYRLDNC